MARAIVGRRYADGSAGYPNRLKGLGPGSSESEPTTWFKHDQPQCAAKNKTNSRRCLKGAQPGGRYCATHGEYQ